MPNEGFKVTTGSSVVRSGKLTWCLVLCFQRLNIIEARNGEEANETSGGGAANPVEVVEGLMSLPALPFELWLLVLDLANIRAPKLSVVFPRELSFPVVVGGKEITERYLSLRLGESFDRNLSTLGEENTFDCTMDVGGHAQAKVKYKIRVDANIMYLVKADLQGVDAESAPIDLTLPGFVDVISENAFSDCNWLRKVEISEGVTGIGNDAFWGCSGLTSVTIPESMTAIGHAAFTGCSGLTKVAIPDSVINIGEHAFKGCSSLTSVVIGKGVIEICWGAFYGCRGLTEVAIPETVTLIGEGAFEDCSSLTHIAIPEGVTGIGNYAFRGCRSLTSVTIPESMTAIGHAAFTGCSSLTQVRIPPAVTKIAAGAFWGCSGLTKLIIPVSVTVIGEKAFRYCRSLTSLTVPDDLYDHVSENRDSYGLAESVIINNQPNGSCLVM